PARSTPLIRPSHTTTSGAPAWKTSPSNRRPARSPHLPPWGICARYSLIASPQGAGRGCQPDRHAGSRGTAPPASKSRLILTSGRAWCPAVSVIRRYGAVRASVTLSGNFHATPSVATDSEAPPAHPPSAGTRGRRRRTPPAPQG